MISYFVEGEPAPQGSKNGYIQGGRVVMVEASSKKLKPWRLAVANQTREARANKWPHPEQYTMTAPVEVGLVFYIPRPKSVTRKWPSVKPDLDKYVRAALDGITTGGLWTDDSLVIALSASKEYTTGRTGCQIIVSEVQDV